MVTYRVPFTFDQEAILVHNFTNGLVSPNGNFFHIASPEILCCSLDDLKAICRDNNLYAHAYINRGGDNLVVKYFSQEGIFVLVTMEYFTNPVRSVCKFNDWDFVYNRLIKNFKIGKGEVTFSIDSHNKNLLTGQAESFRQS